MVKNESGTDRLVRVVIGVAALVGALTVGVGSPLGIILLAVAVIMTLTAALGFCPLYRLFGLSTNRRG